MSVTGKPLTIDICGLENFGDGRYGCAVCGKSFDGYPSKCLKGLSLPWPESSVEELIADEYARLGLATMNEPEVVIIVFFNEARTDFVTVGPLKTPQAVEAEKARLRTVYAHGAVHAINWSSMIPPGELK